MDSGICEKQLRATLAKFGGVLKSGKHNAKSGEVCALELLAEDMGLGHTDNPSDTRTWDLRSLNDMDVSDDVRTEHLIPVIAAYAGSMDWSIERQRAVSEKIILEIFRKVISKYVEGGLQEKCLAVSTVDDVQAFCRARDLARARARDLARDLALALALALDRALDRALVTPLFKAVCDIYLEAAR